MEILKTKSDIYIYVLEFVKSDILSSIIINLSSIIYVFFFLWYTTNSYSENDMTYSVIL